VRECDDKLRRRLKFVDAAAREQITRCLELVTYDVPENRPGIVLPIFDDLNTALPGAPMAFIVQDRFSVIDDTSRLTFAGGVPEPIRAEINAYFENRPFRSFGSIQMFGPAGTLGVVNVEAAVQYVLGHTEEERRQLIRYLLPFCSVLSSVYSNS
jgi:hypothetical protein